MASPRTRRVLKEIKPKDGNNVGTKKPDTFYSVISLYRDIKIVTDCCLLDLVELFRVRCVESPVGQCYIWNLDMFRVFWKT